LPRRAVLSSEYVPQLSIIKIFTDVENGRPIIADNGANLAVQQILEGQTDFFISVCVAPAISGPRCLQCPQLYAYLAAQRILPVQVVLSFCTTTIVGSEVGIENSIFFCPIFSNGY
jgi:hypothetical protein